MIIFKKPMRASFAKSALVFCRFQIKMPAQNTGENDVYRKIGAVIVSFARRMIKGSI